MLLLMIKLNCLHDNYHWELHFFHFAIVIENNHKKNCIPITRILTFAAAKQKIFTQ